MAKFFDQVGDFAKSLGDDLSGKTAKEIAKSVENRKTLAFNSFINDDGSTNTVLIVSLVGVVIVVIGTMIWILTKKTV